MDALASLGIDLNGLVLHLVNFGILLAVLLKFFYKPIMKAVEARRTSIAENLEQAERLKTEFQKAAEAQENEKQAAIHEMQKEVADAKRFGEEKAKALMTEAEARREEMLADARGIIEEMKGRLEAEVEDDVKERMERVVVRVLGDAPEESVRGSIDVAWKEVRKA